MNPVIGPNNKPQMEPPLMGGNTAPKIGPSDLRGQFVARALDEGTVGITVDLSRSERCRTGGWC